MKTNYQLPIKTFTNVRTRTFNLKLKQICKISTIAKIGVISEQIKGADFVAYVHKVRICIYPYSVLCCNNFDSWFVLNDIINETPTLNIQEDTLTELCLYFVSIYIPANNLT